MKKVIKEGKVAALYSPGFGAGWSTWSSGNQELLVFDSRLIEIVADGDRDKIKDEFMKSEFGIDIYCGGAEQLKIEWIDEGQLFEINEYDGSESIHIIGGRDYLKA